MTKKAPHKKKKVLPPFETLELRKKLTEFLDTHFLDPITGKKTKVGNYKFGIYAFFDYDKEPIYVGQTNERLRTRIRRHLTNQRTDAVAMNVLDPFEVYEIQVWPIPQFEGKKGDDKDASEYLNALEYTVFQHVLTKSRFRAVLNEKDPPKQKKTITLPAYKKGCIVSDKVYEIRNHPDTRIARRASTLARLAQVISERQVSPGLRRTLHTQARRLEWLAGKRYGQVVKSASEKEEDG